MTLVAGLWLFFALSFYIVFHDVCSATIDEPDYQYSTNTYNNNNVYERQRRDE